LARHVIGTACQLLLVLQQLFAGGKPLLARSYLVLCHRVFSFLVRGRVAHAEVPGELSRVSRSPGIVRPTVLKAAPQSRLTCSRARGRLALGYDHGGSGSFTHASSSSFRLAHLLAERGSRPRAPEFRARG